MADPIDTNALVGSIITLGFGIAAIRILSDAVNPRTGYREIVYIGKDGKRHRKVVRVEERRSFFGF